MAFASLGTAATIGLIAAGTGAAASGAMALGSNQRRKRRERELDEYAKQSPLYQGSKPISEYYQAAMNRFNENPYQSQQYQVGARNIQRATAQGLGALQDRRSALGGIARLAQGQADALTNLGVSAEAQRNVRFGQLGGATQMKNRDLMQQFQINKMDPYQRQLQLKQLKSQAANQEYAQDVSNTIGSLSNAASIGLSAGSGMGGGGGNKGGLSGLDLAKNDAILNEFNATRGKLNPNFIPNARGIYPQQSDFMKNMSNWNASRSLKG
jgi:hypothetical protein